MLVTRRLALGLALLLDGCQVPDTGKPSDGPAVSDTDVVAPTAAAVSARRLSVGELDAVLADLLRVTDAPAVATLPSDALSPFDNTASLQEASAVWVEGVGRVAKEVAAGLVADEGRFQLVVGCDIHTPDTSACLDDALPTLLRRLFRRDVTEDDVKPFRALADDELLTGGTLASAFETVLRAALQDPEFLYWVAREDPVRRGTLDGASIAGRMSALLWGSTPDDELLDAAKRGDLSDPDGRRAQAERMLASPLAVRQADRFHTMWLGYSTLVDKPEILGAILDEVNGILNRVVFTEKRPWKDIFTYPLMPVSPETAGQYKLAPPASGVEWRDLTPYGRGGVLSTIAFLMATSHVTDTSPTLRGKAVLSRILCTPPGSPPAGARADAPPPPETANCRLDRYAAHRTNPFCASCHEGMDSIGNGLERWDRAGTYREHDYILFSRFENPDCPLPVGADVPGLGHFNTPYELGLLLADSPAVDACMVKQMTSYAFGGTSTPATDALQTELLGRLPELDGRYDRLLTELIASDAFVATEAK